MCPTRWTDPLSGEKIFVCANCDLINPNPRDSDEVDAKGNKLNKRIETCTYRLSLERDWIIACKPGYILDDDESSPLYRYDCYGKENFFLCDFFRMPRT